MAIDIGITAGRMAVVLGFESPALRQYDLKEGSHLGPFLL